MLSACLHAQSMHVLNQLTDFHKNWYRHYVTEGDTNAVLHNFLQSVVTT